MNSFGPSKEELQRYWNSNREHFENLAKYYKEKDPKYYNDFIAPFYKGPGVIVPRPKKGTSSVLPVIIIALVIAIIGGAGAVFYFLWNSASDFSENIVREIKTTDTAPKNKTNVNELMESDYMKGLMFMSDKEYDSAEFYLKRIPESDKNYKDARQVLESIKYLRIYDKK